MFRLSGNAPRIAAAALLIGLAAYYVLVTLHGPPGGMPFDTYGYYIPIKLHAVQSLFDGGKGLLWMPFQSCGEPFFANTATGLLYPLHWLFLFVEANAALHIILALNLLIGAIGMLLLLRELGLGWVAAIAGAIVYELGDPMGQLTIWSPMQNGSWAWVSWSLFACERLLRRPSRRGTIALAFLLTMGILPGWVLITALTYQLIAFRLAWELLTRRRMETVWASSAVAAALILVPCLAAVQLIPAAEFAEQSFRVGVEVSEFVKFGGLTPSGMLTQLHTRLPPIPFFAAILPLIFVTPFAASNQRLATFWLLIGILYAVLALGPSTPLYGLFIKLPPGPALIRYAHRLFWISGLSMAFLTAFVVQKTTDEATPTWVRWLCVVITAVISLLMYAYAPGDLRPIEMTAAAIVAGGFIVALWPPVRPLAPWIIPIGIAINLIFVPLRYPGKLLPSLDAYDRYARSFAAVRAKITPQDRAFFLPSTASLMSLGLMHKTASVARIKEIYDYDALVVRRIVDYYNTMFQGETVHSVDEVFHPKGKQGFRPRLLDLAAVRYVLTVPTMKVQERGLSMTRMGDVDSGLELYRNDQALERARYVPRVEIVTDSAALLDRLANGTDDLGSVAFIDEMFPSGFIGEAGMRDPGKAAFVLDDPERLLIAVDAPARGFLFVADQFYPGWVATINGAPTPILRGNYAFRLIEVPAGKSLVEMRYRPTNLAAGAAISAAALVVCGAVAFWRRRPA